MPTRGSKRRAPGQPGPAAEDAMQQPPAKASKTSWGELPHQRQEPLTAEQEAARAACTARAGEPLQSDKVGRGPRLLLLVHQLARAPLPQSSAVVGPVAAVLGGPGGGGGRPGAGLARGRGQRPASPAPALRQRPASASALPAPCQRQRAACAPRRPPPPRRPPQVRTDEKQGGPPHIWTTPRDEGFVGEARQLAAKVAPAKRDKWKVRCAVRAAAPTCLQGAGGGRAGGRRLALLRDGAAAAPRLRRSGPPLALVLPHAPPTCVHARVCGEGWRFSGAGRCPRPPARPAPLARRPRCRRRAPRTTPTWTRRS
jgi:hypothetical protein